MKILWLDREHAEALTFVYAGRVMIWSIEHDQFIRTRSWN